MHAAPSDAQPNSCLASRQFVFPLPPPSTSRRLTPPHLSRILQLQFTRGAHMPISKTEKIWHNGKFINWDDATLHVLSHVVSYGSAVFEGIRCYALPGGPAIFRATEHMQRLIDSARIYRIEVPFTRDEIVRGMVELVGRNGVWPCYIRP